MHNSENIRNNFIGDRYRKNGILGKGATSVVYQAEDIVLKRFVAIKIPKANILIEKPHYREFLNSEAKYLASLDHPNIIPLYEYYKSRNGPVLVMRYVESNLFHHISYRQKIKEISTIEIITNQIALALDFCEKCGIAHRDVKPDNVLIDSCGHAYLSDFGIAARFDDASCWREPVGNPAYMSPEQLYGEKFEESSSNRAKSDQFSFGVTLYQMITGQLPHDNKKDEKYHCTAKRLIRGEKYIPCYERDSSIPLPADDVLLRMLSIAPNDRYHSNKEGVDEFCQSLRGEKKDIKAFVSFSSKDSNFVEKFVVQLKNQGISVWWANKIEPSQYWDDEIEKNMISSDVMLVIVSPDLARSKESKNEWRYWLEYFDKPLIPVMIAECRPPYRLSSIQHISGIDKPIENIVKEAGHAIRNAVEKLRKADHQYFRSSARTNNSPKDYERTGESSLNTSGNSNDSKYLSEIVSLHSIIATDLFTLNKTNMYIPQKYRIDAQYLQTLTKLPIDPLMLDKP